MKKPPKKHTHKNKKPLIPIKLLGYRFSDVSLLARALTHKSVAAEPQDPRAHNEVLEFLGDAVLELVVTEFLVKQWGQTKNEGDLTRGRSHLINTVALAGVGRRLKLHQYVHANRDATAAKRFHQQLLANTFEAVVGAIFLDSDYLTAQAWILGVMKPEFEQIDSGFLQWSDYRTRLQEYCQGEKQLLPHYSLVRMTGPDHEKTFVMAVSFGGVQLGEGSGPSKKEAAQEASKEALLRLQDPSLRKPLGLKEPPRLQPGTESEDIAP